MILERTKLATLGHLDLLWHQLLNRNIRHIDENIVGQGARLPARSDVVQNVVVSFIGGQLIPGCQGEDFVGVVADVNGGHAYVVLAGNATVKLTTPVMVGDFVYAESDGRGSRLTQAAALAGNHNHKRIIGLCVEAGTESCVVAVRARGWHGALAGAPAVSAEALLCCTPSAASRKPYLLSTAVCGVTGALASGYAFESGSNIASIAVTGNKARFTFAHPYNGLPSVEFQNGFNKRCILNQYVTPAFATAKLYDSNGAAMNFGSVSGQLHMTAKGAAA